MSAPQPRARRAAPSRPFDSGAAAVPSSTSAGLRECTRTVADASRTASCRSRQRAKTRPQRSQAAPGSAATADSWPHFGQAVVVRVGMRSRDGI